MEASQQPDSEPTPSPKPPDSHVFLDPQVIEVHLQNSQPVDGAKARMIYLMNLHLQGIEPEFDKDFGPGIAREGDW